ncbi:ribosome biogenesis GTP-binding protein YihA/YsxC [Fodinisporobacter ferrooxydans]|uniref:Probable GTP-binding protein EngB n=1 Tax=Fodinisporobacter ferrooxydans TaxID=2901836 RepID=A0ABY4CL80_9BACL|nr:ribosome biogenesis GTP-binding protein YihA/YsxC [Alicyclobacillaceae bacterium MYW30-H2]
MIIKSVEFIISAVKPEQYPDVSMPEIALVGRSNVGKSSLINKMLNRRNVARVSSKPGKTQTINFFLINQQFHLVDLPGYGYAKVSKSQKEQWGKMIERYLSKRGPLRAVIQLVDIRHAPSKEDVQMYQWLSHFHVPTAVIATKADKISKGQWQKHVKIIKQTLGMEKHAQVQVFSSETGVGKDEAWQMFEQFLFGAGTVADVDAHASAVETIEG